MAASATATSAEPNADAATRANIDNDQLNNDANNDRDEFNCKNNKQQQYQSALEGATCMELALEGERLCKTGDFKTGIRFFEEALNVSSNDVKTLSAIYSQLGNAYFFLEDYQKALKLHMQDVDLNHSSRDEAAEAKACGNLGNTYKMLGKYDEAVVYCKRYLEVSRKLNDKVGVCRALYNLGNVYHTQGKRLIGAGSGARGANSIESDLIEPSKDVKICLQTAIEYYDLTVKEAQELNDLGALGRAYGNLGNTYYLLGDFNMAVESHTKRLELARKQNDKSGERRACLNLGNANVFLGNYPEAITNYKNALLLAQKLRDKDTESHSCYVLANTYTFLREYKSAIDYHLKYFEMMRVSGDKLGEGRACSSLVNLYQIVDEPEMALHYANKHLELADQLGDAPGKLSATLNIEELEMVISQRKQAAIANQSQQNLSHHHRNHHHHHHNHRHQYHHSGTNKKDDLQLTSLDKRQEQEQRRFKKQLNLADVDGLAARRRMDAKGSLIRSTSNERLFDMIAHFQSGRIDDQRCEISGSMFTSQQSTKTDSINNKENRAQRSASQDDDLSITSSYKHKPSTSSSHHSPPAHTGRANNALSAAASAIKASYRKASLINYPSSVAVPLQSSFRRPSKVSTDHQEKLFDLIAGAQRQRMDEQRASLPSISLINPSTKVSAIGTTNTNTDSTTIVNIPSLANLTKVKPPVPSASGVAHAAPVSRKLFGSSIRVSCDRPDIVGRRKEFKRFQTFDADSNPQDDKFLDSLMRYQSTRFNDQRSEFPKPTTSERLK